MIAPVQIFYFSITLCLPGRTRKTSRPSIIPFPHFINSPKYVILTGMKKPLTYLLFLCSLFWFPNVGFSENLEVKREYWKKFILWGKGNLSKETHFKNGKKEGPTKYWYKSGKIKGERHFKNGLEDGPLIWWYESGKKMAEEHYKEGKKNGHGVWWYENGTKMKEENHKDGRRDGRWIQWYKNGNLKSEYNFKDMLQDGLEIHWNKDGKKVSEQMYIDNVLK